MLWHIGNTTVRTPYRLREALIALQGSPLHGNICGSEQENAFAQLLHDEAVLHAERIVRGEDASDLGRKWRAALSQLGFITPQLTRGIQTGTVDPALTSLTSDIKELSGRPYEITPNGYRLINAGILTAQQECFLRSLTSYRIPSILETGYNCSPFSPLRFLLRIFHSFSEKGAEEMLSFQEYALLVQTATPEDGFNEVADKIVEFRIGRENAGGNVRSYDRGFYQSVASRLERQETTLDDYADLSFRYLKATGLFRSAGRGIVLAPTRAQLADLLRQEEEAAVSNEDYLKSLWRGASLPTDDAASAFSVISDLAARLQGMGLPVELPSSEAPLADLETKRHELEDSLLQLYEAQFAETQANCLEEIAAWMDAITSRGTGRLPNGETITVPKGEASAYLEWMIWRAFLAIDRLINTPWDARRFHIDQDFLPVCNAPGGGPDMIFEFDDAIIVVEVTLTSSSRQEAAEGESVRRHVAHYAEQSNLSGGKPVYGLFIAAQIDSNTAHAFRSGDWYLSNDSKLSLDIVPVTLADFRSFLRSGQTRLEKMSDLLRQMLIECRARANQDAPQWKQSISSIVQRYSNAQ